jgi:hypothetical protein
MFISKKRWQSLIKRIADLEGQIQSQQAFIIEHVETDKNFNDEILKLLKKGLDVHTSLSKC